MLRSLLGLIAPKLARRTRRPVRRERQAERVSSGNFAPSGAEGSAAPQVLLANLTGDRDGTVTTALAGVIDRADAMEVYRANREMKPSKDTNVVRRLIAAADEGREWLAAQQADILIWGEAEGDVMRLRFVVAKPVADNLPGVFGLGDTLEFPAAMLEPLESVVQATVLAAVGPSFDGMKSRLAEALGQAMQGARELAQNKPDGMADTQHATVLIQLGNAFAAQYRLTKTAKNLESAQAVYRNAVAKLKPEHDADIWAVAQASTPPR